MTSTVTMKRYFVPNEPMTAQEMTQLSVAYVALWLVWWTFFRPAIFPSPLDVLRAVPVLWTQFGLGKAIVSSFLVNVKALFLSAAISLPLAYMSRVPVVRPIAMALSKLRFLSPAVFFLLLAFALRTGSSIKLGMLTMGLTFFLLTTMLGVVKNIPNEQFDDARTLRMSEWQATWYVTIRGTVDQALDAIRDNAAIGWGMLLMVEGIVRSEGGVGVMLLAQEKVMNFAFVYAIVGAILIVGVSQDYFLGWTKQQVCPYAD